MPSSYSRDYAPLLASARAAGSTASSPGRDASMQLVVDLLWSAFGDPGPHTPGRGYSWVGFYTVDAQADGQPHQMILAVRRNKPACSPIGLHGMCGRGYLTRQPILIPDVSTLGPNYIACDPRDRSEMVIPCLNADGTCWGVLDADSWDLGAFHDADIAGVGELLGVCGLLHAPLAQTLRL